MSRRFLKTGEIPLSLCPTCHRPVVTLQRPDPSSGGRLVDEVVLLESWTLWPGSIYVPGRYKKHVHHPWFHPR